MSDLRIDVIHRVDDVIVSNRRITISESWALAYKLQLENGFAEVKVNHTHKPLSYMVNGNESYVFEFAGR